MIDYNRVMLTGSTRDGEKEETANKNSKYGGIWREERRQPQSASQDEIGSFLRNFLFDFLIEEYSDRSFYFLIVVLVFSIFWSEFFSELKKVEPAEEFIPILFFRIVLSSEYKGNQIKLKDRLAASMLARLEASKYTVMHTTKEKFRVQINYESITSLCLRFSYQIAISYSAVY